MVDDDDHVFANNIGFILISQQLSRRVIVNALHIDACSGSRVSSCLVDVRVSGVSEVVSERLDLKTERGNGR